LKKTIKFLWQQGSRLTKFLRRQSSRLFQFLWREGGRLTGKVCKLVKSYRIEHYADLSMSVFCLCGAGLLILIDIAWIPVCMTEWRTSYPPQGANADVVELIFFLRPVLMMALPFMAAASFIFWGISAFQRSLGETHYRQKQKIIDYINSLEVENAKSLSNPTA